jgi:hypothetical protein
VLADVVPAGAADPANNNREECHEMTTRKPWTELENQAVINLYFTMLDCALAGEAYTKSHLIKLAQCNSVTGISTSPGPLFNRSRGSIEAKLMNATAAHRDLYPGDVTMDGFGYRALANYQASLKQAMQDELNRRHDHERATA